jgi:hypothetical protein
MNRFILWIPDFVYAARLICFSFVYGAPISPGRRNNRICAICLRIACNLFFVQNMGFRGLHSPANFGDSSIIFCHCMKNLRPNCSFLRSRRSAQWLFIDCGIVQAQNRNNRIHKKCKLCIFLKTLQYRNSISEKTIYKRTSSILGQSHLCMPNIIPKRVSDYFNEIFHRSSTYSQSHSQPVLMQSTQLGKRSFHIAFYRKYFIQLNLLRRIRRWSIPGRAESHHCLSWTIRWGRNEVFKWLLCNSRYCSVDLSNSQIQKSFWCCPDCLWNALSVRNPWSRCFVIPHKIQIVIPSVKLVWYPKRFSWLFS